jgi:hypothetical protein
MEVLYTEMNKLLLARDFHEVNYRLDTFVPCMHAPIVGVGLLRITFPARGELSGWKPLLWRVQEWLKASGKDAGKLLRGLVPADREVGDE